MCSNLENDIKTQARERPFVCTICDKSFFHNYHLKEHGAVHSNNRPFVCSVCSKSFKRKSDLNKHMKFHSKEKLFSCPKCKTKLRNNGSKYSHNKRCKMIKQTNLTSENLVPTKGRGQQKIVKMHNKENNGNRKKKVIGLVRRPFSSRPSKKTLKHKFYLKEKNDQQQCEDLGVKDDSVGNKFRGNKEKAEIVERREHEHYFDPSPGWKLWKTWDVWDSMRNVAETREDEYDFESSLPGWKQWKNWDVWESWKNNNNEVG